MLKIFSFFILLFAIQSKNKLASSYLVNSHPLPRNIESPGSDIPKDRSQYKEYIEYVDEDVEEGAEGPDERYEIVNAEGANENEGQTAADQPNAQVVDDVDLNQFDENGNYLGSHDPNKQFKIVPQQIEIRQISPPSHSQQSASDKDQEYYENEEETDLSSIKQNQQMLDSPKSSWHKITQRVINEPKEDPYKVIENKYPGIFEQVQKSTKNEDIYDDFQHASPNISETRTNNQETEYEYIESEPEVIYDSFNVTNFSPEQMESLTTVEYTEDSEKQEYTEESEKQEFSEESEKQENTEDSDKQEQDSFLQHMDIHPSMSAQGKVIIQQISGPKGPAAVQITEEKLENQTYVSPTTKGKEQENYQETVLKPKRTPRILARYKVIIPVIVPNLRIRVPIEGKHSTISDTH